MTEKYKTKFASFTQDDVFLIQFDEEQVGICEVKQYVKGILDAISGHTVIILPNAITFNTYSREDLIKLLEMSLENLKSGVGDNWYELDIRKI